MWVIIIDGVFGILSDILLEFNFDLFFLWLCREEFFVNDLFVLCLFWDDGILNLLFGIELYIFWWWYFMWLSLLFFGYIMLVLLSFWEEFEDLWDFFFFDFFLSCFFDVLMCLMFLCIEGNLLECFGFGIFKLEDLLNFDFDFWFLLIGGNKILWFGEGWMLYWVWFFLF